MNNDELRAFLKLRNGEICYRSNNRKVPRESRGRLRIRGKLYRTGELVEILRPANGAGSDSLRMSREHPAMILSKTDAVALGFTLFRTGHECKNGHAGWRYVSSGACVDCRHTKVESTFGW